MAGYYRTVPVRLQLPGKAGGWQQPWSVKTPLFSSSMTVTSAIEKPGRMRHIFRVQAH